MDPLMERQTRAIEEIASAMGAIQEPLKLVGEAGARWLESIAGQAIADDGDDNGPTAPVLLTDIKQAIRDSEEITRIEALLEGIDGEADSSHTLSWRLARLIREHKRQQGKLDDIRQELDEHDERGNPTSGGALTRGIDKILNRELGD